MSSGDTEIYHPRAVVNLGVWQLAGVEFKIYGIIVKGRKVTEQILLDAKAFVSNEVPELVSKEGQDNGLGFVIIHPGELGVSFLAHWWIQGSVLCQHIHRQVWGESQPMDTTTRPVIACVWELGLINEEQNIWRETMMGITPDPLSYLETRADLKTV